MDALQALAGQQGCSADGTAATRNPLSQFVQQTMGGTSKGGMSQHGGPQHMQHGAHGQMSDIDRGMAQGMGMMQGPRGPVAMHGAQSNAFAREFEQMQRQGPPPQMRGGEQWVNDFNRMQIGGPQPNIQMEAAFRESFHRRQMEQQRAMANRWSSQMHARPPPNRMDAAWQQTAAPPPMAQQWANEMAGPKEAPDAAKWANEINQTEKAAPDMEATRRATNDLVNTMANNPKFRESEFFQFMSKVNDGELAFENNTVVETGLKQEKNLEGAWAKSEGGLDKAWEDNVKNGLDDAWETDAMGKMENAFAKAWEDSRNGKEVDFDNVWKTAMEEAGLPNEGIDAAWNGVGSGMENAWSGVQEVNYADKPYELASENPYADMDDAYERGCEFFKEGRLDEAILAFESCITKDPSHSDAWRMLGDAHQENDQDPKAIACLERAVEHDAYHLNALLELGVSYVNELDQEKALKNLKAWVINNPNFQGLEIVHDPYGDGSLMDDVMQLMLKAAEWAPNDPDVQEVLGVLYNVSRDYDSAVTSFKKALNAKPDEYTLWNKLGATLANGQRSEEAIPAYHRALELKPRYARGWLNLGISFSNLGNYQEAARCYLKALDLNKDATHIWSYLRICFSVLERYDLIGACDKRNLDAFRAEFKF